MSGKRYSVSRSLLCTSAPAANRGKRRMIKLATHTCKSACSQVGIGLGKRTPSTYSHCGSYELRRYSSTETRAAASMTPDYCRTGACVVVAKDYVRTTRLNCERQ